MCYVRLSACPVCARNIHNNTGHFLAARGYTRTHAYAHTQARRVAHTLLLQVAESPCDIDGVTHVLASDIVYAVAPLGDLARTIHTILARRPTAKVWWGHRRDGALATVDESCFTVNRAFSP